MLRLQRTLSVTRGLNLTTHVCDRSALTQFLELRDMCCSTGLHNTYTHMHILLLTFDPAFTGELLPVTVKQLSPLT